jgi:hypothetical protein
MRQKILILTLVIVLITSTGIYSYANDNQQDSGQDQLRPSMQWDMVIR